MTSGFSSRASLARAYHAADRAQDAIDLTAQTVAECEQVLGASHQDTLAARRNLADSYLAAGRAKDLGIMNIGTNVPQALAPVAAALIIDQLGGYRVLFAFAGIFTFIGATMVYRIKSIR